MTTSVHLATVPSADTPHTCINVRNDKSHYIFGRVPEGTQRAFNSRRTSFAGVTQVFLSGSVGWDQLGGLTGFLLTIASAASAAKEGLVAANVEREKRGRKLLNLTVHGGVGIHAGDNIAHTLASNRGIFFRQPIRTHLSEYRDDPRAADPTDLRPDWQDEMLRVWKIPATRDGSSSRRKRRRLSPNDAGENKQPTEEDEFKDQHPLSDPEVARLIVDQLLFNGDLNSTVLVARKVGDLKPTGTALIEVNGVFQKYRGPFAGEGEPIPNPEDKAWVLPPPGSGKPGGGVETKDLTRIPLPKTSYSQTSMSYIAKTPDRRGKFDRAAAEALGVGKEDFKHLAMGKEVKGKDGTTVTPDMVLGEPMPGRGFIVADISGHDFIESFMKRPEWSNKELMANVSVMYWLLGTGMSNNPQVQQFIQDHRDMRHIICAPDVCPNMISNPGPAELQMMLRRIDSDRFPVPKYDNVVKVPAPAADSNVQFARVGQGVQLMPRLLFKDDSVVPFTDLVTPFNSVSEDVLALAEEAKAKATDPRFLARIEQEEKDIPNRDAEITCLGTGSSVPSKYRNVSGTLIRVPGIGNYLLDCGEGTMGQILRLYGKEETANILRNLRCVVISHLHADHHLGALSVARSWYEQALRDGNTANLAVSCISRYRNILRDFSQIEDFGFHRLRFPMCSPNGKDIEVATREHMDPDDDFGLTAIKHVHVDHCFRSMGTELELTSGLRIAYSGDCRPSTNFAEAFRGAHLLVHECTFGDDMAAHAVQKKHSTMSEALSVARQMRARRTLLTHFSQRYIKADSLRWEDDERHSEGSVLMAFDYMTVKLGDFQKAACYLPALERLMAKTDE